jgi:hypothetical protein
VIARLVAIRNKSDQSGDFVYRVKRVFRGKGRWDPEDRLIIRSSLEGSACGLPHRRKRYGLFLDHRLHGENRWDASLASVVTPREMRRAARRSDAA